MSWDVFINALACTVMLLGVEVFIALGYRIWKTTVKENPL